MAAVKRHHIPGQQAPHQGGDPRRAGSKQEMSVIGHQRPGIASGLGLRNQNGQPVHKILLIHRIPKYFLALDSPDDHMMQYTRRV